MNNIIYIGATNVPNVFHVGMTSNNRSPHSRWRDGDYRGKLPYLPSKVEFYSVGDLRDEPIHSYLVKDKNVTNLHDEGISSDEIFRVDGVDNPVEFIKNLVEEAITFNKTGIRPVDKFYQPRPHQEWVNREILSRFDGSETVIQPLNLCARFGKTLCGLDLFKRTGLQTMIVAGYWLSANESFIRTIEDKFDITSDVVIIKPNYADYVTAINNGSRVVIDLSLHSDEDKIDIDLLDVLNQTSSLIYIDEADYGAWTSSSRSVANRFIDSGINLVCVATGTNIDRALIGSRQDIEFPITVSYLDLIEAKRGEGHLFETDGLCVDDKELWMSRLDDIVEVSCVSLDAGDCLVDELNDLTEEKCPNMAKIFAKRNSHIQTTLLKQLVCDDDGGEDVFGLYSTEYGSIEHPAVMMFIPGTKADVNNLVRLGRSINPEYNWVALHGENTNNRQAEDEVKKLIASGGERTIIISCSMGARSFSVPNIVAVINCVDGGSLGTAVQRASRCFTPGCDKTHGLVVNYSFNPSRTSTFETDLIASALDYDVNDIDSAIRRVYGLANFFKKDEHGYLVSLTESEFVTYVTSKDNLNNMASAVINMDELLNHVDILDLLDGVSSGRVNNEWEGIINKARTFIKSEREKGEVDPDKKAIRDLIKKIHRIVGTVGNTHYLSPHTISFRDNLIAIASDEDKDSEYYNLVGVSAQVVLDNIYEFLPEKFMNLIITKTASQQGYDKFDNQHSSHTGGLFNL